MQFWDKKIKGFTTIELLIALGIISVISAVVLVAIDPARRFSEARNATRWQEIKGVLEAIVTYTTDHIGNSPTGLDSNLRMLGVASVGCGVACGAGGGGSGSLGDSTGAQFGLGTFSNTQWDAGNNWLELTALGQIIGSGNFTSRIFDATSTVSWSTISWTPQRPLYKELPSNAQSESAYPTGNANMTGNRLLMHFNESSGSIADSSGNGYNGTQFGGLTYGAAGKLNTAFSFDGINDAVGLPNNSVFTSVGDFTAEAWIRPQNLGAITWRSIAAMGIQGDEWLFALYNNRISFWANALTPNFQTSLTNLSNNVWYHIAFVRSGANYAFYLNGAPNGSGAWSASVINIINQNRAIGRDRPNSGGEIYQGRIDEIVIYNRALSATEIADHYKRGALRLRFHVRSCDDAACSGETLIGPDGTSATYYSDLNNASISLPSFALTNVADNRYFQYRAYFKTDSASLSPELKNISFGMSGSGESTASSCLDLSPALVDQYIAEIPHDPLVGSGQRTYYAVKKTSAGRVNVISCSPELGEVIDVQR
jgi:competence protein ComGC